MTTIEVYEGLLLDDNKLEAPSILLDEFNWFLNKGINQYVNKRYELFAREQQLTDDLQTILKTFIIDSDGNITNSKGEALGTASLSNTDLGIAFDLPADYQHLLGCIVYFDEQCSESAPAKRLTSDIFGGIKNNVFLQPSVNNPYYYIAENALEVRTGGTPFIKARIEYLKTPKKYKLTQEQLNEFLTTGTDNSEELEFRDYVVYEIIRELGALILEMTSDNRLNTYPVITQSIE